MIGPIAPRWVIVLAWVSWTATLPLWALVGAAAGVGDVFGTWWAMTRHTWRRS